MYRTVPASEHDDGLEDTGLLGGRDVEQGDDTKVALEMSELGERGPGGGAAEVGSEDIGPDAFEFSVLMVGQPNRTLRASPEWTVLQLKEKYFLAECVEGKTVRLILRGKLLRDDDTLEASGLGEGSFVHCAVTRGRGLVVNDPQSENHQAMGAPGGLREFDDAQVPRWLLHGQGPRQGTNGDFMLGFVMGFFLGILTLIWVWQRSVPRRQKVGILLGMSCNFLFSIMTSNPEQAQGNQPQSPTHQTGTDSDPGYGS